MESISIKVPTGLNEMTLEQYQLWISELKLYNNKLKEGGEVLTNAERIKLDQELRQKMIQIFCRLPELAVRNMLVQDFHQISDHLTNVLDQEPELQPIIKFKGEELGFIPNLSKGITFGEYIDLDDFMKDWDNYHKAMAVLYRPIIMGPNKHKQYRIEDYDADDTRYEKMKQLSLDVAMGAVVFFYRLSKTLLEITPSYLQKQAKENQQLQAVLEKNGVGISTYTHLLGEASLNLKKLLGYHWVKPYSS